MEILGKRSFEGVGKCDDGGDLRVGLAGLRGRGWLDCRGLNGVNGRQRTLYKMGIFSTHYSTWRSNRYQPLQAASRSMDNTMRSLGELVSVDDPGIEKIREWIKGATNDCLLLPPSKNRDQVLLQTQVTTRSTMGAIAYETGGVLVDGGWLRFLGSGHPKLTRTLTDWNQGRSRGYYLVADDVVGGFFAINGGAFGADAKNMYYWAPDSLEWEALGTGFTDFFVWALSNRLADFYADLRWATWRNDMAAISGDRCFSFYPFLWTKEGSLTASQRGEVPAREAFDFKLDLARQINERNSERS